jgi:2-polyprenyl-3-methyl-5-hydroxy-6-metoxy-1,4-benzoquinol methylase/uncharacterized protein YbaR (Trm112 family)
MNFTALFCPIDHTRLAHQSNGTLSCEFDHTYPVVEGVPVLLRHDIPQAFDVAGASIARASNSDVSTDLRNPDLYLESLAISEREKQLAVDLAVRKSKMDPVVSALISGTNGIAYKHLVGRDFGYPIPKIRLPPGEGKLLLDIGCGWGRWSIAAARQGYRVVGIDPSLGAVMAGKRVAQQLNLTLDYICGDGRYLPFDDNGFDAVFSYSVIQHFNRNDATRTLEEVGRVLKPGAHCLIQMPNHLGVRNLQHQWRRRFAEGSGFDVRYWSIKELRQTFEHLVGTSKITAHCYLGLGLEPTDLHLMPGRTRVAIRVSECLRKLSLRLPWLTNWADSVYIESVKASGNFPGVQDPSSSTCDNEVIPTFLQSAT